MRAFSIALLAAPLTFVSTNAEEMMDVIEKICAEKERDVGPVKCRRYFSADGYSVQWQGIDTSITHHGIEIQVLTKGTDAVVCWSSMIGLNDRSMCMALERSR